MLNALVKFLVYRFAGARILLAISVLGWLRNLVGSRRAARPTIPDTYAPGDYSSPR